MGKNKNTKEELAKIEQLAEDLEKLTESKYGDKVQRVFKRLFSTDQAAEKEIKKLKDLIALNALNDEIQKKKIYKIDATIQEEMLHAMVQQKVKGIYEAVTKDKNMALSGSKAVYKQLANTFGSMDGHQGNLVSNTYKLMKGVTYSAPIALIATLKLRGDTLDIINNKIKAIDKLKKFYKKQIEYAKKTDNKSMLLETEILLAKLTEREVILKQRAGIDKLEEVLGDTEEQEESSIKKAYKNYAQKKREEQKQNTSGMTAKHNYSKKREDQIRGVNLENIKTNKVNEKEQDLMMRLKSVERILGSGDLGDDGKGNTASTLKKIGLVWAGTNLVGFVSLGLRKMIEKVNDAEDKFGLQHNTPYNPKEHVGYADDMDAIQKNLDAYRKTHPDKKNGGVVGSVSNFFSSLVPTVTSINKDPRENAAFTQIDGALPGKNKLTNVETPLSMQDFEKYLSFPAGSPHIKSGFWKMQKKLQVNIYNLAKDPMTSAVLGNKKISVQSTFRDPALQAKLEAKWIAQGSKYKPGDEIRAKPAKNSKHSQGLAIDIDENQAAALEANGLLKKYGLKRPFNNPRGRYYDPVHIILLDDSNSDISDFDTKDIDSNYEKATNGILKVQSDDSYYSRLSSTFGFKNGGKGSEIDTNMVAVTEAPREMDGVLNVSSGTIQLPNANLKNRERIVLGKGKNVDLQLPLVNKKGGVIRKAKNKKGSKRRSNLSDAQPVAYDSAPVAKADIEEATPSNNIATFTSMNGNTVQLDEKTLRKIWKDSSYQGSFENFVNYVNSDEFGMDSSKIKDMILDVVEARDKVDMKSVKKYLEIKKEEPIADTKTTEQLSTTKTVAQTKETNTNQSIASTAMPVESPAEPSTITPNITMNSFNSISVHQKN